MKIVQVIPRCPPPVCGVADYSVNVARALANHHEIQTRFVLSSPSPNGLDNWQTFPMQGLASRTDDNLVDGLLRSDSPSAIILQYSAYGFDKRGAPLWLARGLRKLKKLRPQIPLITMFHELGSRGPWHTSSFWNWPVQKWIIKELCRLSSHVVTNRTSYADELRIRFGCTARHLTVLPVLSGFGEPAKPVPFKKRELTLAFFGWPMPESRVRSFNKSVQEVVRYTEARKIVVFRHPLPTGCDPGVPVETHPVLPPPQVSKHLHRCSFAYSDYNPDYLGKSSLFAAYCAHGLATILETGEGSLEDGLQIGKNVLSLTSPRFAHTNFSEIASGATSWYRNHDIRTTGNIYADHIVEASGMSA